MKKLTNLFLLAAVLFVAGSIVAPGQSTKMVILVRHAEKDISATADPADPVLTAEGRARAERLVKAIKRYKPGAIYSTDLKRTRDTAAPTAAWRKKTVEIYDPKKLDDLVAKLMASKTKRFLVVGHSNTIPGLANLLAKKELFKNLLDTEHGAIWVIRLKNGVLKKVEVFPY